MAVSVRGEREMGKTDVLITYLISPAGYKGKAMFSNINSNRKGNITRRF